MAGADTSWFDALPNPGQAAAPAPQRGQTAAPSVPVDESSVIDVGGPRYSPSIPRGQQGSQVAVSGGSNDATPNPNDLTSKMPAAGEQGKTDTSWFDALPPPPQNPSPGNSPLEKLNSPTPPENSRSTPENSQPQIPSPPQGVLGSMAALAEGIPRGIVGGTVADYGNAAMQTPFHMLAGMEGPSAAFNEALSEQQARHAALQGNFPIANAAGQGLGMVGTGLAAGPTLGLNAATGFLPKLGAAASYLGKNAAFGGAMSAANGEDPRTGAVIGSALPSAHLMATPFLPMLSGLGGMVRNAPAALSGNQQAKSVARNIAGNMEGGPSTIESSPVGPLTLAQATNNPKIAAMEDVARIKAPNKFATTEGAQKQAIADQISKIGTASTGPNTATNTAGAIQAARDAAEEHNAMLWNRPEVAQTIIPKAATQALLEQTVANLPHGLQLGVTGSIKRALKHFQSMPDQVSVGDLNSVRTALRLASKPSEQNPWAAAVGSKLQEAITDGMDRTLANTPGLPPSAQQAWHEAREFTRQLRSGPLAHSQIEPMLDTDRASRAGAGAFEFNTGRPEGPEALADVAKFIRQVPKGAKLSSDIIQAARDQIATAAQDEANRGPGQLQKFLKTNAPWLKSSGVLDQPQIDAGIELQDYIDKLRRPEMLKATGSATQPRQENAKNFINNIMSPLTQRILEMTGAHTHGAIGYVVAHGATHFIQQAENAMTELTAGIYSDSRVAKDFLTKYSKGNLALMAPKSRDLYAQTQAAITNVMAQTLPQPAMADHGR